MSEFNFLSYGPYLSDSTFSHLQNCSMAYREEQFFASAIWGAVFLEGFLSEFMRELNVNKKDLKVLNDYIGHLTNLHKREKNLDIDIPQEMIYRCNLIREIRNGLVHDTGHSKDSIKSEALTILNSIKIILDLYSNISPVKNVIEKTDKDEMDEKDLIPVFISSINPDNEIHQYFLDLFDNRLRKIGIKPVRAVIDEYDRKDPIGKVKSYIVGTEAVIIIGLERSHAYFLRDRVGGIREEDKIHTKYTSSWLHLEAGLANALEKDIFVTCQSDICNDGIFDRNWNNYPVIEFEWANNVKEIANMFKEESTSRLNILFKKIEQWTQTKLKHK